MGMWASGQCPRVVRSHTPGAGTGGVQPPVVCHVVSARQPSRPEPTGTGGPAPVHPGRRRARVSPANASAGGGGGGEPGRYLNLVCVACCGPGWGPGAHVRGLWWGAWGMCSPMWSRPPSWGNWARGSQVIQQGVVWGLSGVVPGFTGVPGGVVLGSPAPGSSWGLSQVGRGRGTQGWKVLQGQAGSEGEAQKAAWGPVWRQQPSRTCLVRSTGPAAPLNLEGLNPFCTGPSSQSAGSPVRLQCRPPGPVVFGVSGACRKVGPRPAMSTAVQPMVHW